MDIDAVINYCTSKKGAYIDLPFGEIPICVKLEKKLFLQAYPDRIPCMITLKCDRETGRFLRLSYPGTVVQGYHCPEIMRPYFNTVYLDGLLGDVVILKMLDHSYDSVVKKLPKYMQAKYL